MKVDYINLILCVAGISSFAYIAANVDVDKSGGYCKHSGKRDNVGRDLYEVFNAYHEYQGLTHIIDEDKQECVVKRSPLKATVYRLKPR